MFMLYGSVGLAAALAGGGVYLYKSGGESKTPEADPLGITLPDIEGRPQSMRQWAGKVVVINFWATWCEPCREETPLLVSLSEQYGAKGVQFVGISIDRIEPVKRFRDEYRVAYPLLIGGIETMDWARDLGNRAGVLPYTVVVGRNGLAAYTKLGAVKRRDFEPIILGLL
jgi:thiol-disulfide isomerase/thioredoxin